MYTDQRLFRAQALEPVGALGSVLYIVDQSGPIANYDSAYAAIVGIEPVFGIGPHGMLLIWSQGATAPAGYGTTIGGTALAAGVPTGSITNGSYVEANNLTILQQGKKQLFQCRFAMRSTALTGIVEGNLELQVFMPASAGKFGILAASPGFLNMVDQFQDPADAIDAPASAANQTLPAVFPAVHPRDQANMTEMFIWELNGPKFRLWNNGAASATAGTVGLRLWGYRYDVAPLTPANNWVDRWVYGRVRKAPPSDTPIVVIPTAPFQSTGSY